MHTRFNSDDFIVLATKAFGPRWKQSEIASLFDCSQSHVSHLKHGKTAMTKKQMKTILNFIESGRAKEAMAVGVAAVVKKEPTETPKEMRARIAVTFEDTQSIITAIASGILPATVIQGGPGTGKTFTAVETLLSMGYKKRRLEDVLVPADEDDDESTEEVIIGDDEFVCVGGAGSVTGLVKLFWWFRNGGIVVIDDCDSIFQNLDSLNILKKALDSTDERVITYLKEAAWLRNAGITPSFEFKGKVIIITNVDLKGLSQSNHKLAAHYAALLDRSIPLNMGMYRREEVMCRIEQISDILFDGMTKKQQKEVLDFVRSNMNNFSSFTLRTPGQISKMARAMPNWERLVTRTMMD
jgi:hypothetical protein